MQEEVTQKTVTFCIRTTKVTADLLKKVLAAYLRHQKQKSVEKKAKKNQPKQGKVTVKELAKQNAGMVNIEITNKNIKSFERYARKYGINYALKKDKSKDPPMYLVFFKGRDQDALNAAFREFSQKQIQKANKPSIHKRLATYRAMMPKKSKDKVKNRHQEQSRMKKQIGKNLNAKNGRIRSGSGCPPWIKRNWFLPISHIS